MTDKHQADLKQRISQTGDGLKGRVETVDRDDAKKKLREAEVRQPDGNKVAERHPDDEKIVGGNKSA